METELVCPLTEDGIGGRIVRCMGSLARTKYPDGTVAPSIIGRWQYQLWKCQNCGNIFYLPENATPGDLDASAKALEQIP
jgi:hypothetical protein